VEIPH